MHLIQAQNNPQATVYNPNPLAIVDPYQAEFKIAKVKVPIPLLLDATFFKSHTDPDIDVSAIKMNQIFQAINAELQTQNQTGFLPYYFSFDIDNHHRVVEQNFVTGMNLKMYGYPLGHHGSYTGIIRVGHLATSQQAQIDDQILDFCTDMATSGGSSGSPIIMVDSIDNTEKLAGILYAGPDDQADNIGYGLKLDKIVAVCDF